MPRQPVLIILSSSCNFRRILDKISRSKMSICAFENEPIHDDLIAFSSPPDASLRYQLLDEQNQIQLEKNIPYSTALSFIACFACYLSSFNAFCCSTNEKIQSVVNNQAYKA